MDRLFIAVWPTADLVETLCGLPRKDRPGLRWVKPENWHVTLRFLGDLDPNLVSARLDQLMFDATDVRYGPGIDVLSERSIILPAHGLADLASQIAALTSDLGDEPPRKRFVGHVTLARLKRRDRLPDVIGARVDATQRVGEISLVASTLRPEGAVYETVETWKARRSG